MATDEKVSIIVTSTDGSGTVKQKSFTYISPDATNAQLKTFAQAANALTDNVYNGSKKVTQVDLASATDKQTPTFTLAKTTDTKANLLASVHSLNNQILLYPINYSYNGDGVISSFCDNSILTAGSDTNGVFIAAPVPVSQLQSEITQDITITFTAAETNNFKAASATFTITV